MAAAPAAPDVTAPTAPPPTIDAPAAIVVPLGLLVTLPIALRRRYPVVTLAICLTAFAVADARYGVADAAGSPFARRERR